MLKAGWFRWSNIRVGRLQGVSKELNVRWFSKRILGEMQGIAFRLMLSSYVCVCVSVCMPRLWTPGKLFEIETSFYL